jgi:hypothetical protein
LSGGNNAKAASGASTNVSAWSVIVTLALLFVAAF